MGTGGQWAGAKYGLGGQGQAREDQVVTKTQVMEEYKYITN